MKRSGEMMMKRDNRLFVAALISICMYIVLMLTTFSERPNSLPSYTADEMLAYINNELNQLELPQLKKTDIYYSDIVANSSLGRYIDEHQLDEHQIEQINANVSLTTYEVSTLQQTFAYDHEHRKLVKATNISIEIGRAKV